MTAGSRWTERAEHWGHFRQHVQISADLTTILLDNPRRKQRIALAGNQPASVVQSSGPLGYRSANPYQVSALNFSTPASTAELLPTEDGNYPLDRLEKPHTHFETFALHLHIKLSRLLARVCLF